MSRTISLVERGVPCFLPGSDCSRLCLDEPLRLLSKKGVLKVVRTGNGMLLTPQAFVGELQVLGSTITVAPKSPRMFEAMEELAIQGRVTTTAHIEAGQSRPNGETENPVADFLTSLKGCISQGIPWTYQQETAATSFPRGKLRVGETIRRFAARGQNHRVVVRNAKRAQDEDLGRIVHAAVKCLPAIRGTSKRLIVEIYRLVEVFEHSRPFPQLKDACATALRVCERETLKDNQASAGLAQSCYQLLSREYEAAGEITPLPGGVAKFRSLEHLWEKCIFRLVESAPTFQSFGVPLFHGLALSSTTLFETGGPTIDPDIVIFAAGIPTCIIDAKYKRREPGYAAESSDVYQIYSYVRRTAALAGMLVYFSESESRAEHIGTTPEGSPIIILSLSPEDLVTYREVVIDVALNLVPGINQCLIERARNGLG